MHNYLYRLGPVAQPRRTAQDIFLEARSTAELQRNALVCVMLRLLEYHQGGFAEENQWNMVEHVGTSGNVSILESQEN